MKAALPAVLLPYPRMAAVAGGHGLTAWAIEALLDAGYRVTLATVEPPDLERIDHAFGTRLAGRSLGTVSAGGRGHRWLCRLPVNGAHLELCWMERVTRKLWRREPDTLLLSTNNEMNLPVRGLQYVHYPRHAPRPEEELRPIHRVPGVRPAYRLAGRLVSGVWRSNWTRNRTLANSAYIAGLCRDCGMRDLGILHPPVRLPSRVDPAAPREPLCVVLGRIHRTKRVPFAVSVVDAVRARGHALELALAGPFDCDPDHEREVRKLAETRPWLHLAGTPDRAGLEALLSRASFGLHAMIGEHFGMAVAEMSGAGLAVLAHASGGPMEILGGDPDLLYPDEAGAVERLAALLGNPGLAAQKRALGVAAAKRFSMDAFRKGLLREVEAFRR